MVDLWKLSLKTIGFLKFVGLSFAVVHCGGPSFSDSNPTGPSQASSDNAKNKIKSTAVSEPNKKQQPNQSENVPPADTVFIRPLEPWQPVELYQSLNANCGKCHQWTLSLVDVKSRLRKNMPHPGQSIQGRIESGSMPKNINSSGFANSQQGKRLLELLNSL